MEKQHLNGTSVNNIKKEDFILLSEVQKKEIIYAKINEVCEQKRKNPYGREEFELRYKENNDYYTRERNLGLNYQNDREAYITPEDYMFMLYINPNSFNYSIDDNVRYKMRNLDRQIGTKSANAIIKKDPSIIGSSIENLNAKLEILKGEECLESFIKKPKNLRASTEMIYACIQLDRIYYGIERERDAARMLNIPRKKGISKSELLAKFLLPAKYKTIKGEKSEIKNGR